MADGATVSAKFPKRILDPMDRISEVLFGLIMALTFTSTLGVVTADNIRVPTMLVAALRCNLAWGLIDGGVYLMARLNERGRNLIKWRAVRKAADANAAHRKSAKVVLVRLRPGKADRITPSELVIIFLLITIAISNRSSG